MRHTITSSRNFINLNTHRPNTIPVQSVGTGACTIDIELTFTAPESSSRELIIQLEKQINELLKRDEFKNCFWNE